MRRWQGGVDAAIRSSSAALAIAICGAPAVALACPYCAGIEGLGPAKQRLIGAILLLPFLIVAALVLAIRRAERDEATWPRPRGVRSSRAGARGGVL